MTKRENQTAWRHAVACSICKSAHRAEIEKLFVEWKPQTTIAREYKLRTRQVVARHARFAGLFEKRLVNLRGILHAMIEQGMQTNRTIPAQIIVQAVIALSKLDAQDRTVEQLESVNHDADFLNDPRWTRGEMERFAETGERPSWLLDKVNARVRAFGESESLTK